VTGSAVAVAAAAETGRLELTSVRFEPDGRTLTSTSSALLDQLADAVTTRETAEPVTIAVRSYSAPSTGANLDLSRQQAQVLAQELIERGLNAESIRYLGLGAPPLSVTQPIPNFVVPATSLGPSPVAATISRISPFAIGLDPESELLRPESLDPLARLADALTADPDAELGFAAYSFDAGDTTDNQRRASAAAQAAIDHLVAVHGIEPDRLSTVSTSERPFIVGPDVGNHITIRWGEPARPLAVIDPDIVAAIRFAPGSSRLDPEAAQAVNEVAAGFAQTEAGLVVEVHTATEPSAAGDSQLSDRQAEVLRQALIDGGVDDDRLRVSGGGALRQFAGDRPSQVVLSAVR
jgi:outer membrane protein OmpA-like peptidoglycan-associated protein